MTEKRGTTTVSTLTVKDEILILDFYYDLKDWGDLRGFCCRGWHLSRNLKGAEIRSNKHSLLAYSWDELGNMLALCADGTRLQLYPGEARRALRGA